MKGTPIFKLRSEYVKILGHSIPRLQKRDHYFMAGVIT